METLKEKKSTSIRNSDVITRTNGYRINPLNIKIDWASNLREDYGDEDFQELKESIRDFGGIKSNIKVYLDTDGTPTLYHGFRRMKAILELIEEGVAIQAVPFDKVSKNEEEALIDHFILNSGKPLSDVEMAEGLKKLRALSGIDNVAALAKRVGMGYQKAHELLKFADGAGSQVKQSVISGEASFSAAKNIVKHTGSVTEQNELLNKAKEVAKTEGKKRVRSTHIPIESNVLANSKEPFDINLGKTLAEVRTMEGLDNIFYNRVTNLIKMVKEGAPLEEIKLLFIP